MQNAKKLTGTGIFINEDLPEDARLQGGELRSLPGTVVTHAKHLGHTATMKGDTVNIDGQSYRHRDLSLLPPELSLAAAKTVSTDAGIVPPPHKSDIPQVRHPISPKYHKSDNGKIILKMYHNSEAPQVRHPTSPAFRER